MRFSTLIVVPALCAVTLNVSSSRAQRSPSLGHRAADSVAPQVDTAKTLNDVSEANEVLLSARMYNAIRAVESYRNSIQRKALDANELAFDNFDIRVIPGEKSTWLKKTEADTCFAVVLEPKLKQGEKVFLDGPRALGRMAGYAVRKSDFVVVRSELRAWTRP